MSINEEKKSIIKTEGNVLVTANPGTGKTLLLAHKYASLIEKGIKAEQILCLTFTEKAKRQMENNILKVLAEKELKIDTSKLNVYTFHSYALDCIENNEILSANLLRYAIFQYLREHQILNYADSYLLDTIVPKLENLIRYMKSFGITPNNIDIEQVKPFLEAGSSYSIEEIKKFADDFLGIFNHYEEIKNKRGVDYADLLIKFGLLREPPVFDYVLVDELQDVNLMEADIALKSGKTFIAVGDKKQAIFGFQGGSILNFRKFQDSSKFVLSENFRSTDEILSYARKYFIDRTEDDDHKEELKNLRSADGKKGPKPIVYDVAKKDSYGIACEMAKVMEGSTAIIARTNYQIMDIGKELKSRGIEFSSTFYSASNDAKSHIITFLKGILSENVDDVKNSMFTPFFPCSIQKACEITDNAYVRLDEIYEQIPTFKDLKNNTSTIEDVNTVFRDIIIPISISYGQNYFSAALTLQEAFQEALEVLENKSMHSIISFLQASDLLSVDSKAEKGIIVTSVHKAKGREFDNVIYIPTKTRNSANFQDKIVEAALSTKDISVGEELGEETLRVNFVAFTRAQKQLVILTDKVKDYLNEFAEQKNIDDVENIDSEFDESKKRAYDLFVHGDFDEAKKLLKNKERWLSDYVQNHFQSLEHTSFSKLPDKPFDYFTSNMLNLRFFSTATNLGSEVHDVAEGLIQAKEVTFSDEAKPFVENLKQLMGQIKEKYPDVVEAEKKFKVPLSALGFDSELIFKGFIDAIFKNGDEYLIVDWKTDKKTTYDSKHRQQLEVYKRAYSALECIPVDKIKVAIAYVGLRSTINTGNVEMKLDDRQPAASAFNTFSRRVEKLLGWIKDPEQFLKDFIETEIDDTLWRSIAEEYWKENEKRD